MRDKRIADAIDSISVSEEAGERMYSNILQKSERRKKRAGVIKTAAPFVSAAACAALVLIAVNIVQYGVNNYDALTSGEAAPDLNEAQMRDQAPSEEFILAGAVPDDSAQNMEADGADEFDEETAVIGEYIIGADRFSAPAGASEDKGEYEEGYEKTLGLNTAAELPAAEVEWEGSANAEQGNSTNAHSIDSDKNAGSGGGDTIAATGAEPTETAPAGSLGVSLVLPEEALDVNYSQASEEMTEVDFSCNGHYYVIYCCGLSEDAAQIKEKLSGENIVETEELEAEKNMILYSVSGNEGTLGYRAVWNTENNEYMLVSDDGAEKNEVYRLWVQVLRDNGMAGLD